MTETREASSEIRSRRVSACPLCGGGGDVEHEGMTDRLLELGGRWNFRRCRDCGSLWLDPQPIAADLHRCYPAGYYTHEAPNHAGPRASSGRRQTIRRLILACHLGYGHLMPDGSLASAAGRLLGLIPMLRRKAAFDLGVLFPHHVPSGRLLDVGCGSGAYLAAVRAHGWAVLGTEVDPVAADVCRRTYGLEVWEGPLEEVRDRFGCFDVVVMSHVLEHVADPKAFLLSAARPVRGAGLLLIATPNPGSLGHRVFGPNWFPLLPPQHLSLSTPRALRSLAEQLPEWEVVTIRSSPRLAAAVCREALWVRRSGIFGEGGRSPRLHRLVAAAFSWLEKLACSFWLVGEELQVVMKRREHSVASSGGHP